MSDLVIREVKAGVTIFSRPFQRAPFVHWGGRSTAIKLNDGSVWLFASTKADTETLEKIRSIGPVKYIIAPDYGHWLNLRDFSAAFPEAKVIGVDGLDEKVPKEVKFAGLYGKDSEGTLYGYEDEIEARYFSGFENRDVAFFHKASKTLIEADLLFNLPPREQYSKSGMSGHTWIPLVGNINPHSWVHKTFVNSLDKNTEQNAKDAKVVDSWDFDMIIPCHGDVVDTDAKKAWKDVWGKWLNHK